MDQGYARKEFCCYLCHVLSQRPDHPPAPTLISTGPPIGGGETYLNRLEVLNRNRLRVEASAGPTVTNIVKSILPLGYIQGTGPTTIQVHVDVPPLAVMDTSHNQDRGCRIPRYKCQWHSRLQHVFGQYSADVPAGSN